MQTLEQLAEQKRWKEAKATPIQLDALRTLATSSGITFSVGITRGQAWQRICRATKQIAEPKRLACAPPWYEPST